MNGLVDSKNSTAVYALVTIGLLICFTGGIYVGRTYFREAAPGTVAQADQPDPDIQDDLEFYDDLVKDDEKTSSGQTDDPESVRQPPVEESTALSPETSVPPHDSSTPPAGGSPNGSVTARDSATDIRNGFTVQLGAVNNERDAGRLLERLRQKGYQGILVDPTFSGDRYYRVWVGKFVSREEAVEMSQRLKGDQFDTFVKRAQFPPDS